MTKDASVRVRINPAEKLALRAVARVERRNMSEVIRDAIRERARRLGLWPPPATSETEEARR